MIQTLLAFFGSPVGQALIAQIPDVVSKVTALLIQQGHLTPEEIATHLVSQAPGIDPLPKSHQIS